VNKSVRDFFANEIDHQTTKTPDGKEILLSKTPLIKSDIGDQSTFISKDVPNEQTLKILDEVLNLGSDESFLNLIPDAQSWEVTQKNKLKVTEEIEKHLATSVKSSLQQKMSHCTEELISNAIYAVEPWLKSKNGPISNEKPVQISLSLDSDMQILVIRDQYGTISKQAKSEILAKITKETINPQMKREGGGAGIGLNLVKEFCDFFIIRHHGGQWTETCCFFFKRNHTQTPFLFMEV